ETGHQEEHEQAARRRRVEGEEVREEVGTEGGGEDDRAAHGRGAALRVVRGGTVVADELAVAALDEELDEQRCAEQRDEQRERRREEDALHDVATLSSRGATSWPGGAPSRPARRSPS